MSEKPLAGLIIMVTRPRDQAKWLAHSIRQFGGIPLLLPLLEILPAAEPQALYERVSRLAQFDLAVFISPNAVRFGFEAIRASNTANLSNSTNLGQFNPSITCLGGKLRIASVGQGSAKALRELGITNVIAPTDRFDSEGLLAMPELQNIAGWRVMIFRGDGGRELLGDTLKARGATVEYAACYRRSHPQWKVKELFEAAPDAITVTSSEALCHLWKMLDDAQRAALCAKPIFLPHQRIAELARQQGWQQIHLSGAGDDGLLSALVAWSKQKTKGG